MCNKLCGRRTVLAEFYRPVNSHSLYLKINLKIVIQHKPDNILNFVQSDDPYAGIQRERDERFGETQCPSDNPSMCDYDPSKYFVSKRSLLIV